MNIILSIVFLLGTSCTSRLSQSKPLSPAVESVDVEIVLSNGDSATFSVELDSQTHGSHSFMKRLGHSDDFAISVAYSYAGRVRLENPFSKSDMKDGHVIAFRLFKLTPETLAVQDSQLVYGLLNGSDTIVSGDYGVRIVIHDSQNKSCDDKALHLSSD